MSIELAAQALQLKDSAQIRELLSRRKSEIDSVFSEYLLDMSVQYGREKKYDAAWVALRVLFASGQVLGDVYISASALYHGAVMQIARRDFDSSLSTLNRCIIESSKSSEPRCAELKAKAHSLVALLQNQQYLQPSKALENLQYSLDIYQKLQKSDEIARTLREIEQIRQSTQNYSSTLLADELDEISRSKQILGDLHSSLASEQEQLDEVRRLRREATVELSDLLAQRNEYIKEGTKLREQITYLHQEADWLRARVQALSNAGQIPLWAAAIRAEIADGETTNLTLPLLERLRISVPEYAEPLVAEIRARNGICGPEWIDATHFDGEVQLFAGVANSLALEEEDPLASIEALLSTWETYLASLAGSDR